MNTKVTKTHENPSERTTRAMVAFGVHDVPAATWTGLGAVKRLRPYLRPGARIAIIGTSGSGKSRLLEALWADSAAENVESCGRIVFVQPTAGRSQPLHQTATIGASMIDELPGPAWHAWSMLSRVGLADPLLLKHPARSLSDGESFRLLLAKALSMGPTRLFVDEFASLLDVNAAKLLCITLARATASCVLVAASNRTAIAKWLDADVVVRVSRRRIHVRVMRRSDAERTDVESK